MGHEICPELMYRVLAAELMTWSMACIAKLNVINSTTGLSPLNAEPTESPVNPASVMGVSYKITRGLLQEFGPK